MKDRILYNWNPGRIIRVVLGSMVLIQGLMLHEYVLALLGGLIGLLALLGINTCGAASCTTGPIKRSAHHKTERLYEELDTRQ